ncbi:Signal peptidase I [Austwickia sp. TVS 96-490-7B]|uniref:signal peptidase I n=1 Tax=Austwickia sp. TVS 96-490-7B TaxID=2830843 RepID=UPI001C58A360|nr:signal peptidase I [Austwickia sp. TVS 96-490-7B]MBW3084514.1 Signal peptidase I [Austwickia sp. TVS 96-490-7B]
MNDSNGAGQPSPHRPNAAEKAPRGAGVGSSGSGPTGALDDSPDHPHRTAASSPEAPTPTAGQRLWHAVRETALVIVLALVLSSVVKTFLVQPFWIPSDSMNDTLIRDDRVIVSKLTPGPFSLSRGDVVVFEDPGRWLIDLPTVPRQDGVGQKVKDALAWVGVLPSQEDNHLIKRVIGLPGDHVKCCSKSGKLEVNGVEITEPYVFPGDKASTIDFDIRVPEGKVWVMGDHRSNSRDSRYNDTDPDGPPGTPGLPEQGQASSGASGSRDHTGYYGSVPIDKVVGKAMAVVWPVGRFSGLDAPESVFANVPPPKVQAMGESRPGPVAAGTP